MGCTAWKEFHNFRSVSYARLNLGSFPFPDYVKMGVMKIPEYFSVWKERQKEEKRKRELAIRKAKAVAKTLKGIIMRKKSSSLVP